ncbi:TRAM domain-containing protein [Halobaculum sp. WSA2]|uniref:TRAM domain-containing protein n=1 Tax=Halobaculum saliterrae TaxID=2073113 RepID=A0A6B0T3T0_9EURY|nr:TRAM domain-containing protein [Halobaculum saliterrae]MXR42970.1 TRAM domain-containing protein [Halobaculum saliterrae]
MVEIPDSLCSLFTAKIKEEDGTFVIEIPPSEIKHGTLTVDETYRIALLDLSSEAKSTSTQSPRHSASQGTTNHDSSGPPVDEGEVRDVTIETVGDQGDGIAKVERGYVVIVPGAQPGDEPTVEIEQVQENVAFASIVDSDPRAL